MCGRAIEHYLARALRGPTADDPGRSADAPRRPVAEPQQVDRGARGASGADRRVGRDPRRVARRDEAPQERSRLPHAGKPRDRIDDGIGKQRGRANQVIGAEGGDPEVDALRAGIGLHPLRQGAIRPHEDQHEERAHGDAGNGDQRPSRPMPHRLGDQASTVYSTGGSSL